MAELIEQRRLLLRPKIVTSIKRMDQPDTLGDAAFRDTGASLRREGQSFRQIAEALELNGGTAPRYEETVHKGVVLHQMEMGSEPDGPDWPRTPTLAMRIAVYPFRHPIRFLTIALLSVMLFNSLHDFAGFGRRISGYVGDVSAARERADAAMSSVSSFVEKRIMRPSQEAAGPATSTAPIPSSLARQLADARNSVGRSRRHVRSHRNRGGFFRKRTDTPSTSTSCPSQPNDPNATSRREGRPCFKPGSERSSSNGVPARARGHHASKDPPQFPDGGAMCRWRRRLNWGGGQY